MVRIGPSDTTELGPALDRQIGGIDATVFGQVGDEDAGRDAVLLTQTLASASSRSSHRAIRTTSRPDEARRSV